MGSIVAGPPKGPVEFLVWWGLPDYTQRVRLRKDPVTGAFSSSLNIKKDRKPTTTDAFIFPPWAGWSLPKPTLPQGALPGQAIWGPPPSGPRAGWPLPRWLCGAADTRPVCAKDTGCPQHWCHRPSSSDANRDPSPHRMQAWPRRCGGGRMCPKWCKRRSDFRTDPAYSDLERIQRNVLGGQARIPA